MTEFASDGAWRAGVHQDYLMGNVRFCLVQLVGDDHMNVVTQLGSGGGVRETRPAHSDVEFLSLPESAARALLDALSQHFGGTGDTRQMRRDLDAERKRVDKLTDAVIAIATTNGSRP
jgi:hypothetical protein